MFSKLRFESREAAEDLSPGREPWVRRPSPRPASAGPPPPAGPPPQGPGAWRALEPREGLWAAGRAGEGKGERDGASTHGLRRGRSYVARRGRVTHAANFGYRTLAGWGKTPRRDVAATLRRHRPSTCNSSWRHKATA